jgi:iron complex transport system substrate-binding protein
MVFAERIVALSPAVNEILFALKAGEDVVANTTYATYPPQSAKLPKVGGYFSPSLERIIAARPTLVVTQADNPAFLAKLRAANIEVLPVRIDTLAHIREAIRRIGERVGKTREAERIVAAIDTQLQRLKGIVSDKRILIVYGAPERIDKRIYAAGHHIYFNDIIRASGNRNAVPASVKGQPVLSVENIIAFNPDIIIILAPYMQKRGLIKKRLITPWKSLPVNAARNGDIYVIGKTYAGIPSQRIVLFMRDFEEVLRAAVRDAS